MMATPEGHGGHGGVIRSVRIASTLNDRFAAILRSTKAEVTLDELELKIGEAQQIYPEIWRHLDEARAALVQRGIAVASYDALRAAERPGSLGVTRVEIEQESLSLLSLVVDSGDGAKKLAEFNVVGHQRATAACTELMRALPEVDWAGLARAEDEEIAAIGSLHTGQYKKLLIGIAAIVALCLGAYYAWGFIVAS